ncbi:phosphoribosylamine--glycine ligase [Apilactobacillus apisilvae]|uniref:Phosphoribosylamine--glycine ligase n=1 Tax=Apilactobacillus apisilvae TaxID=2923364 RepID=A0ABY4PIV2_9LACO|nr:phosphoribosylamine--glycine ligase [Apilactobacillus apisilvae]UQS85386.1 phosphoribosylamine--glycine ligase [Apilactobacillus apisilvae]
MENWLVIGSGGREYAIAKCLAKNKKNNIYVAPGNVMMNQLSRVNCVDIDEMDFIHLIKFAKDNQVICTVVGPEQPLSKGIVDAFKDANLNIFGPDKYSAQLESSKAFAKEIMKEANIPTANYREFKNFKDAITYIDGHSMPVVIKANGLANGKGVIVAQSEDEARTAVEMLFNLPNQNEIIVEDFLSGQEFSFIVMANGEDIIPMPLAQDHKRLMNDDKGPNTGGMGAYSPLPQFGNNVIKETIKSIIKPLLHKMKDNGHPFTGFLYAGLVMTEQGIKVIEFNVRMGDPETQVILPQLKSDFGNLINELLNNQSVRAQWDESNYHLGVVLAAKGYPKKPVDHLKLPIFNNNDLDISYAGVQFNEGDVYSHGGRIMMVTSKGDNIAAIQKKINKEIKNNVNSDDYVYRTDIGSKAISETLILKVNKKGTHKLNGLI